MTMFFPPTKSRESLFFQFNKHIHLPGNINAKSVILCIEWHHHSERMKTMNEKCTTCLSNLPLAYSYTPIQQIDTVYDNETALSRGTVFPELYKPKGVYGKEFTTYATDLGCMANE